MTLVSTTTDDDGLGNGPTTYRAEDHQCFKEVYAVKGKDAAMKVVDRINGLTREYDRLWQSIADEAPEEVMGVIEQQTRARDQHPLETDARPPAAFEPVANLVPVDVPAVELDPEPAARARDDLHRRAGRSDAADQRGAIKEFMEATAIEVASAMAKQTSRYMMAVRRVQVARKTGVDRGLDDVLGPHDVRLHELVRVVLRGVDLRDRVLRLADPRISGLGTRWIVLVPMTIAYLPQHLVLPAVLWTLLRRARVDGSCLLRRLRF